MNESTKLTILIGGSGCPDDCYVLVVEQLDEFSDEEFEQICNAVFPSKVMLIGVPQSCIRSIPHWTKCDILDEITPKTFVQVDGPERHWFAHFLGDEKLARLCWPSLCVRFAKLARTTTDLRFCDAERWRLQAIAKHWNLDASMISEVKE